MINVVKYGTIAGLAILGTLATGGNPLAAVLTGGLAIASKGVEEICETSKKDETNKTLNSILPNRAKGKSLHESRERSKMGLPPAIPRDKRIAGR